MALPVSAFIVSLLLTALVSQHLYEGAYNLREQQFRAQAGERAALISEQLHDRLQSLDSVRRFFEHSELVSAAEFEQFSRALLEHSHAVLWAPLLQPGMSDYPLQLQRLRQAGVMPKPDEQHFPLLYQVSRCQTLPAGMDMGRFGALQSTLRMALQQKVEMTGPVQDLTCDDGSEHRVLPLLVPVYHQQPGGEADLQGVAVLLADLSRLMAYQSHGQPRRPDALRVTLRLQGEALFDNGIAGVSDLRLSQPLGHASQPYQLELQPTALFMDRYPLTDIRPLALTGCIVSLLGGMVLYQLLGQRQIAMQLAARRTAELEENREALRISEERWNLALDGAGEGVWDWDLVADRMYLSTRWKSILGYEEHELRDHRDEWRNRVHPDDVVASRYVLRAHLRGQSPDFYCEHRLHCHNGSWKWVLARGRVVQRDHDGQPLRMIGTLVDISIRKSLELQLRHSNARLTGLLEAASQVAVIAVGLDGKMQIFNRGAERMLGYSREEMLGQPLSSLLAHDDPHGPRLADWLQDGQHAERESVLVNAQHEEVPVMLMLSTLEDGSGHLLIAVDISNQKIVEAELRTLSVTDPLTGIHNRRHFLEQLDIELSRLQRTQGELAMVMLDVDHFKQINDRFGHDAGDVVLRELCQRVNGQLRRGDVFCRLGGEEFALLCPQTSLAQAGMLAERLRQQLATAGFPLVGRVTASFGVARVGAGETPTQLLQRCDRALYAAKAAGRNRVCGHETDILG